MDRSRHCTAVMLLLAAAWQSAGPRAAERGEVRVGPNVQVSKDRAGVPHWEVILAADPAWAVRFAASHDGGKTWGPSSRVSEKLSVLTAAARSKLGRRRCGRPR